jgi:plastocyanin
MRTRDVLGLACAALPLLGGASVAATTAPPVEIRVFQFRPGRLEVPAGTTITWTNRDDITHTVTSGTPDARDGRFDGRLEGQGTALTVEFKERGVYPYFCDRHPSMRGEVRVN